jgi:hypothetical protein
MITSKGMLKSETQFYNDCDSVFTQAEKDFLETATNKKPCRKISLSLWLQAD